MYLLKTEFNILKFFYLKDALEYGHKSKLDFVIFKKDKMIANIKHKGD